MRASFSFGVDPRRVGCGWIGLWRARVSGARQDATRSIRMESMMAVITKPCVYCGDECEGTARVKRKDGSYAHKRCAERRQAQQAGREAGAAMDALLSDLPDVKSRPACPGCGVTLASADVVVCVRCGFNVAEGRAVSTRTGRKAAKKKAGFRAMLGLG